MTDPERELLSAAYDRQTDPAEQARIEQLRASEDARHEWREFEQLSGLLKELPRHELPAEFPSRVLKIAEQRSLLPTPAARPARPRWIAPFVTAAAALLVVVGVAWFTAPPRIEMGLAMQEADSDSGSATPPAPADAPPQLAMSAPMAEEASPPAPSAPQASPTPGNLADRAAPGQVVQQPWGNVEVVAVYLVDSVDGVQAVQSAFARNAVVMTGKDVKQPATRSRNPVEGDEALLIVASNEQIEKSLEDLKKTQTVASVVDEDAVEVAKLSGDVRQFFIADLGRYAESAEAESAKTVRMQMEEKPADPAARKSETPVAESATGTVPATRVASDRDMARQQTAIVSELVREELAPAPDSEPTVAQAIQARSGNDAAKSGTGWRRLIVLVRRSPQPAAAAPARQP